MSVLEKDKVEGFAINKKWENFDDFTIRLFELSK